MGKEMLPVGLAIVAVIVMLGGGTWIVNAIRGKKDKPPA